MALKRRIYLKDMAPPRLGLGTIVLYWLLLDRLGIPGWAWGVFWTLAVIFVVADAVDLCLAQPYRVRSDVLVRDDD